ncbi:hypothetical protein JBKA6_1291 [Ichthyobacterium seriolicida]|uniref:Lipoprotein n=1 Tax=Ichthyobacterium seriolicida TaxID=242600 RepID=A0A1J1ECS4_9FLAO|nr:hypothetical protein JBKA6_1291 [Ichthyobacterium seriolicida]
MALLKLLPVVLLLFSCNASKALFEKGQKLEQAGMHQEAVELYLKSLKEDNYNIDARIALKKTGLKAIAQHSKRIKDYYSEYDYKNVVNTSKTAKKLIEKSNEYKVNLEIDEETLGIIEYSNEKYIDKLFKEAQQLLIDKQFTLAEDLYKEILSVDENNAEATEKLNFSKKEPIYLSALEFLEKNKNKKAYYLFEEIGNYRDASKLKELAKKRATFKIFLASVNTMSGDVSWNREAKFLIEKKLSLVKDPFVNFLLGDSQLVFSEGYSDEYRKKALKLDASAILFLTIESNDHIGSHHKQTKKGWEEYKYEKKNPDTGRKEIHTGYDKIYYVEHSQENRVNLKIKIRMESVEKKQIIFSDYIDGSREDRVNYIEYEGNKGSLRTGYWKHLNSHSDSDVVRDSFLDRIHVSSLLNARKEITSAEDMKRDIINSILDNLSKKIVSFDPEENSL